MTRPDRKTTNIGDKKHGTRDGALMGIVRDLPSLDVWPDADADTWSNLPDPDYKALVRRWCTSFAPVIAAGARCQKAGRALASLESRLPAHVYILSSLPVPELLNTGGRGPAAYRVNGLRRVPRDFANEMELIVIDRNFGWSSVFSHEAGVFVSEQLYERSAKREPDRAPEFE